MNANLRKEIIKATDKQYIDIEELKSKNIDTIHSKIYLCGVELTGGTESPNPLFPYFFGTLDSQTNIGLEQSQPLYHFSPKDEENNLGTLLIFLNSSTLTLLNYSLLNSSLNITLELTHKESKTKQEEAKVKALQQTQSKKQTIPLSTSYLHPVLEDNEIKCSHGGVVQLKSNLGKTIQSNNIPFILETT